jgi:RNA polymerase sigma-70 factor (ECF subfamily)
MRSVRAEPVDSATERRVVDAALRGDQAAFEYLYRLYSTGVYAYTLKRVSDPPLAQDLVQEVFLQVHKSLVCFGGHSSLSSWIVGIARNVVSHHYRARACRITPLRVAARRDDIPFEARTEHRVDAVRVLRRCAEVLSKTQRPASARIFYLRYCENNSIGQIAKEVRGSDDAVKASLRRSRCALLDQIPELREFLDTRTEAAG